MTTNVKNQIIAILRKRLDESYKLRDRARLLLLNVSCKDEKSLNKWKRIVNIYSHYYKETNDCIDMLNYICK